VPGIYGNESASIDAEIWERNQRHFTRIAPWYRELRKTDLDVIHTLKPYLTDIPRLRTVDIGCGAGRYDREPLKMSYRQMELICIDTNMNMLRQLQQMAAAHGARNHSALIGSAQRLPLRENSVDAVCTFNAVHHFSLGHFLHESGRVLRRRGYLFIYTRLRSQNSTHIWGRYFPGFCEKETRLYELHELKQAIEQAPGLRLQSVKEFTFARSSTLENLLVQAKNHHYSTFCLYERGEFSEALNLFKYRIISSFRDMNNITWIDENILLILQKEERQRLSRRPPGRQ